MPIPYREQSFKHPALLWLPLEEVELGAMDQIRASSGLSDLASSLRVMPDCHRGYGVTIGSVLELATSVLPNAVGVDIGCGMAAARTNHSLNPMMDKAFWRAWQAFVAKHVPHGIAWFKPEDEAKWGPLETTLRDKKLDKMKQQIAGVQLGTLGGGNHFLEALVDETGTIWVMVHSGSRRIGKTIAEHYDRLAQIETPKRERAVPIDLTSLTLESQAGQDYMHDMRWATAYAKESRARMINTMLVGLEVNGNLLIDCAHNYAEQPIRDGSVIHRKGATYAGAGVLGIIPGSMGTNSYIVRGKGSQESLESCSHGAGRQHGRVAAAGKTHKKTGVYTPGAISMEDFAASLVGTYSTANSGLLDESPGAYKDIDLVIERQLDLIDVVHVLRPLITIKGGGRDEG